MGDRAPARRPGAGRILPTDDRPAAPRGGNQACPALPTTRRSSRTGSTGATCGEPNQLFHMWAGGSPTPCRRAGRSRSSWPGSACSCPSARRASPDPSARAPCPRCSSPRWRRLALRLGAHREHHRAGRPARRPSSRRPARRRAVAASCLAGHRGDRAALLRAHGHDVRVRRHRPRAGDPAALVVEEVPVDLSVFLASGATLLLQQAMQRRVVTPMVGAMPSVWHPVITKLKVIPQMLVPSTEVPVRLAMFALFVIAIGAFFWLRRGGASRGRDGRGRAVASSGHAPGAGSPLGPGRRGGVPGLPVFPISLNGATLVYQRWFAPAFAVLAVSAAPREPLGACRAPRSPAGLRRAGGDPVRGVAVVRRLGPGVSPARGYYRPRPAGQRHRAGRAQPGRPPRTYSLGTAAGRILATRGGRLVYAFTDSPVSPVILQRKFQWNESLAADRFRCVEASCRRTI